MPGRGATAKAHVQLGGRARGYERTASQQEQDKKECSRGEISGWRFSMRRGRRDAVYSRVVSWVVWERRGGPADLAISPARWKLHSEPAAA